MKRSMVDTKICRGCDICEVDAGCPQKAVIPEEKNDKPWINFYKCRGCMKYKTLCKNGAVLEETKPCDEKFTKSW